MKSNKALLLIVFLLGISGNTYAAAVYYISGYGNGPDETIYSPTYPNGYTLPGPYRTMFGQITLDDSVPLNGLSISWDDPTVLSFNFTSSDGYNGEGNALDSTLGDNYLASFTSITVSADGQSLSSLGNLSWYHYPWGDIGGYPEIDMSIYAPTLEGSLAGFTMFDMHTLDSTTGHITSAILATPIPGTVWLFGSGIVFLFGVAKRK